MGQNSAPFLSRHAEGGLLLQDWTHPIQVKASTKTSLFLVENAI